MENDSPSYGMTDTEQQELMKLINDFAKKILANKTSEQDKLDALYDIEDILYSARFNSNFEFSW